MTPSIIDAVLSINPVAECVIRGTDIDTCVLEWYNDTAAISRADIKTKLLELRAAYDALAYARTREKAYPELKDFAEAYCEKEIGGDSTKWDAYVIKYNLVRSNNPKP